MAQAKYIYPAKPFMGAVLSGSKEGSLVNIRGTSFRSSNKICIYFQIGPKVEPRDDVALHIVLDFNRNLIVRNSMQGQNWGLEETSGPPVNLVKGQSFNLDVLCDVNYYKIIFNGEYYVEMEHRIPCINDFYLVVDGDVLLFNIQINDLADHAIAKPLRSMRYPELLKPEEMGLVQETWPIPEEGVSTLALVKKMPRPTMSVYVPPGMNVEFVCIALNSVGPGDCNLQENKRIINNLTDSSSSNSSSSNSSSSNVRICHISGDAREETDGATAPSETLKK